MSSDSEMSILSETSGRPEEVSEGEEDEDVEVIYRLNWYNRITPYEDEPLAVVDEDLGDDEEADIDGLTTTRYKREVPKMTSPAVVTWHFDRAIQIPFLRAK